MSTRNHRREKNPKLPDPDFKWIGLNPKHTFGNLMGLNLQGNQAIWKIRHCTDKLRLKKGIID
ncbi:hypothetical protein P872_01060 [Rhodonellum psychrophilum GCM71 = DSM 17998]|uniref:Uncharacterized protein n=1 Tax=Rhodonellum psychrophilum GCM71 = DSM 17998 TaxID=1123057 RepID=U5C2T7_9BACT|nr:hypothetical protein P872_01060 [Rhodonellum psychrophilum GCM71 = DSM 17998]